MTSMGTSASESNCCHKVWQRALDVDIAQRMRELGDRSRG